MLGVLHTEGGISRLQMETQLAVPGDGCRSPKWRLRILNEGEHLEAGLSGDGAQNVLYESDAVVVVGVVAEGSPGGWGNLADGYAVRNFNLLPWKRDDGELNFDPLLVLEKVEYNGTLDDGEDDSTDRGKPISGRFGGMVVRSSCRLNPT